MEEEREKKEKKKKEKSSKHDKSYKSSSSKHELKHKKEKKEKKDKKEKKEKKKKSHKEEKKEKKEKSHRSNEELIQIPNPISIDDYFLKSIEFRVWLFAFKHRYFEDLNTEENRRLFQEEFVVAYNAKRLPDMYYTGDIPMEVRQSASKTQHRWKLQLDNKDKERLHDIAEDVEYDTKAQKSNQPH